MSESNYELPDETTILDHQTAGHRHEHGKVYTGMLKHVDGSVMKPVQNNQRGKIEIEFYKQVSSSLDPVISRLQDFIPRFLGLHQFATNNAVNYFIKMEDVALGLVKPCIADIKIGRQTWDPFSSPEKRISENLKYAGTKDSLGLSVCGMVINDLETNSVLKLDKYYGRTLNSISIRDALQRFLNGTRVVNRELIRCLLSELYKIRLWFEEQRLFLFYATSVLIVYDADQLDQKNFSRLNARVKMIDFAHVYQAHGARDSNYLDGLCNLIHILETFSEGHTAPVASS